MKEVVVEVIGTEPPCVRCQSLWKVVEGAVSKLKSGRERVKVTKLNVSSKETVKRYGLVMSPAVSVNGTVRTMGRVPSEGEMLRILTEALGE